MEIYENDVLVAENQLSFDIDELELDEMEESLVLTEEAIATQTLEWTPDEVLFVVVKTYNDEVFENLPSLNLFGKQMIDWVLLAGSGCERMVIDDCEDIMARVKSICTNKKYVAVFYSDTPLLDKGAFYRIIEQFVLKSRNFLSLKRGFIVRTDYLRNNSTFMQGNIFDIESEALTICDNAKSLSKIYKTLKNRILAFHIRNGVTMFGENTICIDADVEIDSKVIIYPNNVIKGESIISSGTILESGNYIDNSIISNDCLIINSHIENSKISSGKKINAGSVIKNQEIN